MPKLWSPDIDDLHVLLCRARLKWAEKSTDDSDYALERAIEEATYILNMVTSIQEAREARGTPKGGAR